MAVEHNRASRRLDELQHGPAKCRLAAAAFAHEAQHLATLDLEVHTVHGLHRGYRTTEKAAPNRLAYAASKAAVAGFTRALAIDHVKQGIRVNCVCPGTVDTPSLGDRINAFSDPAQARKDFIARQPMGRLATAEEIAETFVYLVSDESSFMTGQAVFVDGGMSL